MTVYLVMTHGTGDGVDADVFAFSSADGARRSALWLLDGELASSETRAAVGSWDPDAGDLDVPYFDGNEGRLCLCARTLLAAVGP